MRTQDSQVLIRRGGLSVVYNEHLTSKENYLDSKDAVSSILVASVGLPEDPRACRAPATMGRGLRVSAQPRQAGRNCYPTQQGLLGLGDGGGPLSHFITPAPTLESYTKKRPSHPDWYSYRFTASTSIGPSACPALSSPAKVSFCSQPVPLSSHPLLTLGPGQ